jgi:hypothetical protein
MPSRRQLIAATAAGLAALGVAGCGTSAHHAVDHSARPIYDALCVDRPSAPPGASESRDCPKHVDLRPLLGMGVADGERWASARGGYRLRRVEPLAKHETLNDDEVANRIDVAVFGGVITRIKYFG